LTIPDFPANLGTGFAVLYSLLYVLMEPVAGSLLAPFIIGGTAYSNHLLSVYGVTANKWAIALNIVSWIAQFVGHGKFEGRAPALLDNLVQAFFLAPFFVWFEILFYFGYRPELKSRLDKAVAVEIKKFRDAKAAESTNGAAGKTS
jgi:2-hydroxy fatty acid dioxygenase